LRRVLEPIAGCYADSSDWTERETFVAHVTVIHRLRPTTVLCCGSLWPIC